MSSLELIWLNASVLLAGLGQTLRIALVTLVASVVIGVALGVAATASGLVLRWAVRGYVELLRGIPLVVNVFFVFFGAPLLGLNLSPYAAAVLGLSLWGGANGAEIVRGALGAVPPGQAQAARALGLRGWQAFLLVVAPQALRAALPAWAGLLALLVQSTTLAALVGVPEFLKVAQLVVERSTVMQGLDPAFTVYGVVLTAYFLLCTPLTWAARRLERQLGASSRPVALPQA